VNCMTTGYFSKTKRRLRPHCRHSHACAAKVRDSYWVFGEFFQWAYRGCIRGESPMTLFVPTARMRRLVDDHIKANLIDTGIGVTTADLHMIEDLSA
jgi:hypothetical protein